MRIVFWIRVAFLVVMGTAASSGTRAEEWTQFRGPGGNGVSQDRGLPETWSDDSHVVWRAELPGLGTSSPITVRDRVYVTCYSGYGIEPSQGDMGDLRRHLVCLDRPTGKILWTKDFQPELPESEYSGGNNSRHGYSSATPASDGERLYLFFGKSGVFCLTLDGTEVWRASVGTMTHGWGSANSPILHGDLVIVNASVESGALVGLDKQTGKEVWRAGGIERSWNTPLLVPLEGGGAEVVVSTQGKLLAFDPASGTPLWDCNGIRTYACSSAIAHDGIVYVTGGRGQQSTLAVRAGGRGDVTESHVLWRVEKGSNVSSLVYQDGYLYCAQDQQGILFCFDARTGDLKYEQRLEPRPDLIYSSPILADGKLFYVSQHEGTFVVAAQPKFKLLAHNSFASDGSRSNASPVVSDGHLLLRSDRYLYCLGM